MIDWKLEVEDVACPVDDMKKSDCSRSFVQRPRGDGLRGGKGEHGFRVQIDGISKGGRKDMETPRASSWAQDIDACDVACGRRVTA